MFHTIEEEVTRPKKLRGVFVEFWSLGRAGHMSDRRAALGKATEKPGPMEGSLMWTKLKSRVCGEMGKAYGGKKKKEGIKKEVDI